jgi:hypothetical protein
MRIRVGDLVKRRITELEVFAICLVTRNQALVGNNTVGVEVEYLFLEGDPQEIDRFLSHNDYASEEDYINDLNKRMWMRRMRRSRIVKVLS